jgi:hypothetical protein
MVLSYNIIIKLIIHILLSKMSTSLSDLKYEIEDSSSSLSDLKYEIEDSSSSLSDFKYEIEDSSSSLSDFKYEMDTSLSKLKYEIEMLKNKIIELNSEISKITVRDIFLSLEHCMMIELTGSKRIAAQWGENSLRNFAININLPATSDTYKHNQYLFKLGLTREHIMLMIELQYTGRYVKIQSTIKAQEFESVLLSLLSSLSSLDDTIPRPATSAKIPPHAAPAVAVASASTSTVALVANVQIPATSATIPPHAAPAVASASTSTVALVANVQIPATSATIPQPAASAIVPPPAAYATASTDIKNIQMIKDIVKLFVIYNLVE